ncbi:MAG TPA: glutamine amidotransferase [Vicinamibacterales bacterium]|jgi:uncharacterized membrane protein|nr:glutamine amidotransferase [Vicinamibacterales bacterium]
MGWLFRALFKYPAFVFDQGDFRFATSRSAMWGLIAIALIAGAVLVTYRRVPREGDTTRDRVILIGLRLGLIAVLLFCLLRPMLVLKAAVPQQNFLGILIDDSRSMTIADKDGKARTDFVQQQLTQPTSPLLTALSQRFVLRYFKFSSSADRVTSPTEMQYGGTASRLGSALERARDELAGLPLAGLVMVTDGADTSDTTIDDSLASLKARQIPVFPVGVGQEHFARDIQITRVETPRSTLKGTTLSVDVVVSQTGYGGSTVPLTVEDDGRIVSSQDVKLPPDGESATVRVNFTANETGPRQIRFKIAQQDGEQVAQNNIRDSLLEVADRRERVLYFEGEPRSEEAFVRRAVQEDKNLSVSLLVRTAENKYWRGDVNNAEELVGGFPQTREELFEYKALILGSVEAASFTPDQLRMLADFVSKRGGGLLMLGGRRSFAEGGWPGTPLGEVLPVEFNDNTKPGEFLAHLSVRPTDAGTLFPVTQLAPTIEKSNEKWDQMPMVTAVNPISKIKPGATALLTGLDGRTEQIVLAWQRYGRGKAVAMPIQDSWAWQMNPETPVDDPTFSTFWRRMVRWLVDGVPDQVSVTTSLDRVDPGEPLKLSAEVLDKAFVEVNDARVVAEVTSPSGTVTQVPLEWSVKKDGLYTGNYIPAEQGMYSVKATAVRDTTELGSGSMHARVAPGDSEYFDAAMRAPLLKRIAEDTGGRFFTPSDASSLPEAISYSGRGVTVVEERDLWDMPAIFLLMLLLAGGEWLYRRTRGLA